VKSARLRLAHRVRALAQRCGDLGGGESRQAELDYLNLVGWQMPKHGAELLTPLSVEHHGFDRVGRAGIVQRVVEGRGGMAVGIARGLADGVVRDAQ
jgi:hypothetical protein